MVALDEFEQEEQIKQWIKQNVPWIVGGVVIGLAGIFGYRYWETTQLEKTAMASDIYDGIVEAYRGGDIDALERDFATLQSEHPGGSYELFGSLFLAKSQADAGDYDQAISTLQRAMPIAEKANFADLVRTRMARIHLANASPDQALALLNQNQTRAFQAISQELAGDAYLAKDDIAASQEAYRQAFAASRQPSDLLQQKYMVVEQIAASRGVTVDQKANVGHPIISSTETKSVVSATIDAQATSSAAVTATSVE